ncbi:hypothetical protein [Hymenobacter terricola]|uniref:hypothetical protein n=1 Tax=Hymenobacter terricola TaxID=2819236 RepID=UPI001B3064BE|nr:hypothetical protein [Hymenobacter terricola]
MPVSEAPASLATAFAQRLAARDNPPPAPPLSQEPAAVLARLGTWLAAHHAVRDVRSQGRLGRMLLALMQAPECGHADLRRAAGLTERAAGRSSQRLHQLGLATWEQRSYWRYWRLTRAAEDALLLVVAGPEGAIPPV